MIITVLPVPPPSVRPSVRQDNNQRSEDDLTYALANIIKDNRYLRLKLEAECQKTVIESYHGLLQYHVATFIDNEIPGIPQCAHRSGRCLKTIAQRLKGKEGRMRGNLMGKRVDYSGRTVISVDPNISIDEYGIPLPIAMNLTYPEVVTKYNKRQMEKLVRNGPNQYPGAKSVKKLKYDCNGRPPPCTILLKHVDPSKVILEEGDIVNRHLQNGDICLFNRQPSLHRMSMMAMKVRILKGSTFKLNVYVCQNFNADFDGDEMNVHVPQSTQTVEELTRLTLVPTQIISPSKCIPTVTIVQDSLTGAYLFTQEDTKIDKRTINNLMMKNKYYMGIGPATEKENGQNYWTGQQVFSQILPEISLKMKNKSDQWVKIETGNFVEGVLDSNLLGAKGLIQNIYNMYGKDRCHQFLDATQDLITRWLENNGFSVGLGDAAPFNKEKQDHISDIVDKKVEESRQLITQVQQGLYQPNLDDQLRKKSLEADMIKIFMESDKDVVKYIVNNLPKTNRLNVMVSSGSKGKDINLRQIMGTVGQQDIWGERISDGFTDRTLPHFHKNDYGAAAKGFVENSYIKGLSPAEFFFHMMAGRTGMIDTAVKTAESGYISRRLIKALEDLKVLYDGTVRNSANNIVQFMYGDDNYDPTQLSKQELDLIKLNNLEMENRYKFSFESEKDWENIIMKSTMKELLETDDYQNYLNKEYDVILDMRDKLRYQYFKWITVIKIDTFLPFNLFRFIPATLHKFNIQNFNISDLNPIYIINKVNELCDYVVKYLKDNNSMLMSKIFIKSFLSSKRCVMEYRLNKIAFDYIIESVGQQIIMGFVQAGEAVGTVAAQSLGEISTQLTLNTFHHAGIGAKSVIVTKGVPRLKEIINISKNIKTPSMIIYLRDEYNTEMEKVQELMTQFKYTKLEDIVYKTQIIYDDPDDLDFHTTDNEEIEFIQIYNEFNDIFCVDVHENLSKWVLLIEFDKEATMANNLHMAAIQEAILQNCNSEEDIQCIISDDNSANLTLRIRVKSDSEEGDDFLSFFKILEKHILTMTIRGVKNIKEVGMEELNIIKYKPDGTPKLAKEWTLNTYGTNLTDVLSHDYVDFDRTSSNDIVEIYQLLGIEAVRNKIIEELYEVFIESGINIRHIELLADIMTYRGTLMQIDRHGINRSPDNSVITKASFEEVNDIFLKAAMFAELDRIKGVSANVMLGQFAPVGTNSFGILFDEKKLMKNGVEEKYEEYEELRVDEEGIEKEINEMYEDIDPDLEITNEDFSFGYSIENIQEYRLGTIRDVVERESVKIIDTGAPKKKIRVKRGKK